MIYRAFGKRLLDVAVSGSLLLLFAPLLAILALLVRWRLGSPVLFRQPRPGLGGRTFLLAKFRSMTDARGPDGEPLPDDLRVTPLGKFLRATSLDELPELWHVLVGDMSLVGPRPLLVRYLPYYTSREARRHDVRPGLTGWAQVNGRSNLPWDERIEMDVWYVERCSFWLDLKILFKTVAVVLRRENVTNDAPRKILPLDEERRVAVAKPRAEAVVDV